MNIITFTTLFPNNTRPYHPPFVKRRMFEYIKVTKNFLTVVAPVPYFPPLKSFSRWYMFSQVNRNEFQGGAPVSHPRFLLTPKIGMTCYGVLMFLCTFLCVRRLHKKHKFDIVDAHYLFPDGLAAVLLGACFNIPVILSGRGTDVNSYLTMPGIKSQILFAVKKAKRVIAVSEHMKKTMIAQGIEAEKIVVVPNGVDIDRFKSLPKSECRKRLGLPKDAKIILSVGTLTENKGHRILIEALGLYLKEPKTIPYDFHLYIIGDGERKKELKEIIRHLKLVNHVTLLGEMDNGNLPVWYGASDVFCLASFQEGYPNVICEALACGVPVLTTNAGGTTEMVQHGVNGFVVGRTERDFANAFRLFFDRKWNHSAIAERGRQRNWQNVAMELDRIFQNIIDKCG